MLQVSSVNNVSYPQPLNNDDNKKNGVTTGQVATTTGAAVAGANVAKSGSFNMFKSANKVKNMTKQTADMIKLSTKPVNEAKGVFAAFGRTAKSIKDMIVKWGATVTDSKLLKPILTSKLFKGAAGCIGGVTAIFVTIAGIGQIFNTTVNTYQNYKNVA